MNSVVRWALEVGRVRRENDEGNHLSRRFPPSCDEVMHVAYPVYVLQFFL